MEISCVLLSGEKIHKALPQIYAALICELLGNLFLYVETKYSKSQELEIPVLQHSPGFLGWKSVNLPHVS